MFSDLTPVATLPVSDFDRARQFYEGKLGLKAEDESAGGVMYTCGNGRLFVYPSQYAGTNKGTAVTFTTADPDTFDAEVAALRTKGVSFQTFEAPDMVWKDDVAVMGDYRGVWFTDPDNNILNLGTM